MTDWFSKTPAEKMMDTMLRKHPVYGYQDTPKEFFPGQGGVPSIYQGSVSTLDPLGGIYGGERAVGANVGLLEKAKRLFRGANKEPVRYHGTGEGFSGFLKPDKVKSATGNPTGVWGTFFTNIKGEAKRYVKSFHGGKGRVVEARLNLSNPYEMSMSEFNSFTTPKDLSNPKWKLMRDKALSFKNQLIKEGYDGIIVGKGQKYQETVVFSRSQIINPESVRKRTGWFKGMDKKWRFEIDDSKMKLKNIKFDNLGIAEDWKKLGDFVDHPEVSVAYPEIMDKTFVKMMIDPDMQNPRGSLHQARIAGESRANQPPSRIDVFARNKQEAKEILIHEIQHAVQEIEGFARGGSPEGIQILDEQVAPNWKKASDRYTELTNTPKGKQLLTEGHEFAQKKLDYSIKRNRGESWSKQDKDKIYMSWFEQFMKARHHPVAEAYRNMKSWEHEIPSGNQYYKRLAGEIEARDAADRMRLTVKERIKKAPKLRHDAIVRETK